MARKIHHARESLRKAALKRKVDARKLLESRENRHARGAGYLGGYAVECKLKAIAMEVYDCRTLDQFARKRKVDEGAVYTHGLEAFAMRLTPSLWSRLSASEVWPDFATHVRRWRVRWRYDPKDWSYEAAKSFLDAVDRVFTWLESNRC